MKQGIKRYIEKAIYNKYISKLNYIRDNKFYIHQIYMEQVRLVKFSEIDWKNKLPISFILFIPRLILIPKLTENKIRTDTNGLYYMRARYYNTNIERLISQDIPIGIAANAVNAVLYFQEG